MDEVNRITYICPRAAGRPISMTLTRVDQLRVLEAEAVHVIREVVAELERPVDTGITSLRSSSSVTAASVTPDMS
jgi:hypothetical protein